MQGTVAESTPRDLFTVAQLSERRPCWTQAALRNLILNASDRVNSRGETIPGNGLAEAGAIVRVGRRVLIDELAFFQWIAAQQKGRAVLHADGGRRREHLDEGHARGNLRAGRARARAA